MDNEQRLAVVNKLANLAREATHGAATDTDDRMWQLVYGQLRVEADDPAEMIAAFEREYRLLLNAATLLVMAIGQEYAEQAGISDIDAIDQGQALVQAALEG